MCVLSFAQPSIVCYCQTSLPGGVLFPKCVGKRLPARRLHWKRHDLTWFKSNRQNLQAPSLALSLYFFSKFLANQLPAKRLNWEWSQIINIYKQPLSLSWCIFAKCLTDWLPARQLAQKGHDSNHHHVVSPHWFLQIDFNLQQSNR